MMQSIAHRRTDIWILGNRQQGIEILLDHLELLIKIKPWKKTPEFFLFCLSKFNYKIKTNIIRIIIKKYYV